MSSVIFFNLDQSKILSSGNGLKYIDNILRKEKKKLVTNIFSVSTDVLQSFIPRGR